MTNLDNLYCAILTGNVASAVNITKMLIEDHYDPNLIIHEYMAKAMVEIGVWIEEGKAFEPELMMSVRAMNATMELLKPLMSVAEISSIGSIVIGTVEDDTPYDRSTQVVEMLQDSGFDVVNLEAKIPND